MDTSFEILTVGIALSTYNEADRIERCLLSCLNQSTSYIIRVVVCDDGSTDNTVERIAHLQQDYPLLDLIQIEHGERGMARGMAIEQVLSYQPDFLFFIDADMILAEELIDCCIHFLLDQSLIGALVIPEIAFSSHTNYWTKVKVFERNIIGNTGEAYDSHSIEAARFWRREAFQSSGGLNTKQIAFEEIQPSLRYIQSGGNITRATFTYLRHDEKYVTLKTLLQKKAYYFSKFHVTATTEKHGLRAMLSRWYFFRATLYHPDNLRRYLVCPDLSVGVFLMYWMLTFIAVYQVATSCLPGKDIENRQHYANV